MLMQTSGKDPPGRRNRTLSRTRPDDTGGTNGKRVRVAGVDRCGQQQTGEEVKELEKGPTLWPHRLVVSNKVATGHM